MKECVQIITTTNSKEDAEGIARELVENRLAACVQIVGPVKSVFWWDDKIEWATEWLCVAKTRGDLYSKVEESILQCHAYETPEILAVPVVEGSKTYISWLNRETGKRTASCADV